MAPTPLPELTLFMALVLVLSLYGLAVSGHFPKEHRGASLRPAGGRILLWGTLALCAALAVATLAFAWRYVPLVAAVIGGGAMLLIAPLVLRPLPDSFVDGAPALLLFTGLGLGLALAAGALVS
jgi:hypothetical protein